MRIFASPAMKPMKLHSSEFPLNSKMVAATEEQVHYERPRDTLSETWDRLQGYYTARLRDEHRSEMEENDLYRMLCSARVEAETGKTVYSLIDQGILKAYRIAARKKQKCRFKPFILDSCIKLLERGIEDTRNAIRLEQTVWNVLKDVELPIKLADGEVRIYVTDEEYVCLNEEGNYVYPEEWRPRGLTCRITYMDMTFEHSSSPEEFGSPLQAVNEYFAEKRLVGEFGQNNLKIEISERGGSGKDSTICRCVMGELRAGVDKNVVLSKTTLFLSRILVNYIIGSASHLKFLNYPNDELLADGLTRTFFVIADGRVVKARRPDAGRVEIYVDETPVELATNLSCL
jgi:hypothetical protein